MFEQNTGTVEQSTDSATETTQQTGSIFDEVEEQEQSGPETASEESEGAESQNVEQAQDDDADWLPDEQRKVFTDDDLARYAKRFGYTLEEIAADERLKNSFSKMINSDLHIRNLTQAQEQETENEEETGELEPTQQTDPAKSAQEMNQAITQYVDQVTDTETAKSFYKDLDAAVKKDPTGVEFTKVLSRGVVNLARQLVPDILTSVGPDGKTAIQRHIESLYPGLGETHTQTARQTAVDRVRQSNPAYKTLPNFGTPEFEQLAIRADKIVPGFADAVFTDQNGRPLSQIKNFERKVQTLAHLVLGGGAPNIVQQTTKAVETGKRIAQDSARNKKLANLGAGHSKGLQPQKLTGNDDIFGAPGEVSISQKLIGRLS